MRIPEAARLTVVSISPEASQEVGRNSEVQWLFGRWAKPMFASYNYQFFWVVHKGILDFYS